MCIHWPDHVAKNVKDTIFVKYRLIGQIENQVKFMNIFTEHISQCNQSASGKMVDLMNENEMEPLYNYTKPPPPPPENTNQFSRPCENVHACQIVYKHL